MIVCIHPQNPQERLLQQAVDCLRQGGVIIYPTDTIYGLGCDIHNPKAIERIARIKNIPLKKSNFSFLCSDLSHISDYTLSISTPTFRMLKSALPGPYTFIFEANKNVPRLLKQKKNTVGIRVPDNKIARELIELLGNPIISTSLPQEDDVAYYTDASLIEERFGGLVDMVIDGGVGNLEASTVIDCTGNAPVIIRHGQGSADILL